MTDWVGRNVVAVNWSIWLSLTRLRSGAASPPRVPEFTRPKRRRGRWSICLCCPFRVSSAFLTSPKRQVSLIFV